MTRVRLVDPYDDTEKNNQIVEAKKNVNGRYLIKSSVKNENGKDYTYYEYRLHDGKYKVIKYEKKNNPNKRGRKTSIKKMIMLKLKDMSEEDIIKVLNDLNSKEEGSHEDTQVIT